MNDPKTILLLALIDEIARDDFALDTSIVDIWIERFISIYSENYRQPNSVVFNQLQKLLSGDEDLNYIIPDNLTLIEERVHIYSNISSNIVYAFSKLSDYIKLEIARFNFIQNQIKNHSENVTNKKYESISEPKFVELKTLLDKNSDAINTIRPIALQAQKELDGLDQKLENNKMSSITTLTIFSAVVLAFSGGITFEAGVFQGISEGSAYRLVFIVALTGFVLFNTIFALLYIVSRLSGKSVENACKYTCKEASGVLTEKACGNEFCRKPYSKVTLVCRLCNKFTYVFVIDSILLLFLYEDYILWLFHNGPWDVIKMFFVIAPLFLLLLVALYLLIDKSIQHHRAFIIHRNNYISPDFTHKAVKVLKNFGNAVIKSIADFQIEDDGFESIDDLIKLELNRKHPSIPSLTRRINSVVRRSTYNSYSRVKKISFYEYKSSCRKWNEIKHELITKMNPPNAI